MANSTFTIGQRVQAVKMSPDSHYLQVIGSVTGIRNGFVQIEATEVLSRFTNKWQEHPTTCSTAARIENVVEFPHY